MVKSSAADLITGKESDIGHEGLLTVCAGASLEEVSKIMWKKRIGVVRAARRAARSRHLPAPRACG